MAPRKDSSNVEEIELTDEQYAKLVDKVWERIQLNIGKAVVRLFLYVIGPLCVAAYFWLKH